MQKLILLDFGISELYQPNHEINVQGISVCYSPPEMKFFKEKSIVTPKSDIFSFGMFFFTFYLLFF